MRTLVTRISRMERSQHERAEVDRTFDERNAEMQARLSVFMLNAHRGTDRIEREDCPDETTWQRLQADRAWFSGDFTNARRFDAMHIGRDDPARSYQERLNALFERDCPRSKPFSIAARNARTRTRDEKAASC